VERRKRGGGEEEERRSDQKPIKDKNSYASEPGTVLIDIIRGGSTYIPDALPDIGYHPSWYTIYIITIRCDP